MWEEAQIGVMVKNGWLMEMLGANAKRDFSGLAFYFLNRIVTGFVSELWLPNHIYLARSTPPIFPLTTPVFYCVIPRTQDPPSPPRNVHIAFKQKGIHKS